MPFFLRLASCAVCFFTLLLSQHLLLSAQTTADVTAAEYFAEGLRHVDQKRFKEAIAAFEKSAELNDTRPETYANIGTAYIALRDLSSAETAFRKAILADPNNGRWHTSLCSSLSLQKKHAEAIRSCEEGVRLSPDLEYTQAGRLRAIAAADVNNVQLRGLIEAALGQFRNSSQILEIGAKFYLNQRNFAQAVPLLEQLVYFNPNIAKFHGQLAESYLKIGRDAEALASARKALELEPDNPFGNYVMGLIFFELGQHDETATAMAKVLSADPNFDDAKYLYAISESNRRRHAFAVELLTSLVEKDPNNHLYNTQLGRDLSTLGRFEEAESAYLKANKLQPNDVEILAGIGLANMSLARFERAITFFDEALAVKPGEETVMMFLRVARSRQATIPQITSMIKAAEERPNDLQLLFNLVNNLAFAGRIDEATVYVEKIYKMAPSDPSLYQRLGVSFSEAGRKTEAIDAYQRSLAVMETPDAHLGMAGIYASQGNFEAASTAYAKVIELKPDTPTIMLMYGNLLRDNGKRREVLEMYKRSLAIRPANAVVIFNAGIMSAKLGNREEAETYLASLRSIDPRSASILERCLKLRLWG